MTVKVQESGDDRSELYPSIHCGNELSREELSLHRGRFQRHIRHMTCRHAFDQCFGGRKRYNEQGPGLGLVSLVTSDSSETLYSCDTLIHYYFIVLSKTYT